MPEYWPSSCSRKSLEAPGPHHDFFEGTLVKCGLKHVHTNPNKHALCTTETSSTANRKHDNWPGQVGSWRGAVWSGCCSWPGKGCEPTPHTVQMRCSALYPLHASLTPESQPVKMKTCSKKLSLLIYSLHFYSTSMNAHTHTHTHTRTHTHTHTHMHAQDIHIHHTYMHAYT